jgi:hypothetical protein
MVQEAIVAIILVGTVIYCLFQFKKSFTPVKSSKCDGCPGCDLKNIQKLPEKRQLGIQSVKVSKDKFSYQCNPNG